MADEINTTEDMTEDYLAIIEEMKKNSVSKDAFEKMKDENRRLLNQIVTNNYEVNTQEQEEELDIIAASKELENAVKNGTISNLDWITQLFKIRDAVLKKTGHDIAVSPYGSQYSPTLEDEAAAAATVEGFERMIEEAGGSDIKFKTLFADSYEVLPIEKVTRR